MLDFQKLSSNWDISFPFQVEVTVWLVSVRYLGTLYLPAYVLESPSGSGILPSPASSFSFPVGSLGNAIFCECTLAPGVLSCVNVPSVSEKCCSLAPGAAQAGAKGAPLLGMKAEARQCRGLPSLRPSQVAHWL